MPVYFGSSLLSLPPELLIRVLENTGPEGMLLCQMTCRTFRDIVKTNARLQYLIQLWVHCKIDICKGNLTPVECTDILRRRELSWGDLYCHPKITLSRPAGMVPMVFSCGLVVLSNADDFEEDENVVIAHASLPSYDPTAMTLREFDWHQRDISFDCNGICFDVMADLAVFLEIETDITSKVLLCNVHLLTLSSGMPHPDASSALLRFQLDRCILSSPEIFGDNLALICVKGIWPGENLSTFVVVDWKTGVRKDVSGLSINTRMFTFLGENMILCLTPSSLDIFTFSHLAHSMRHTLSFALPAMGPANVQPLLLYDEGPCVVNGRHTRLGHRPLYQSNPVESLVGIMMEDLSTTTNAFILVTQVRTLLSRLPVIGQDHEQAMTFVSWDEWGPSNTRLIEDPFGVRYSIHGTRLTASSQTVNSEGLYSLQIYDFNRHRMRVNAHAVQNAWFGERDDYGVGNVYDESVVVDSYGLFQDPITTKLPYHLTSGGTKERYCGFLTDDETIIGVGMDVIHVLSV